MIAVTAVLLVFVTVIAQDAPRISIIGDKAAPSDGTEASGPPGGDVMQQLLNWGIEHSDPERLKELMQKYQDENLTIKDVYGQDVLDALFVNEGSVMKNLTEKIAAYANASIADEDLEMHLEHLMELVEQVDNAGNLHRMGGLRPLVELGISGPLVGSQQVSRSESVRSLALWTLGVATQNNAPVQEDLMDHIGALPLLLGRLPLCDPSKVEEAAGSEYCTKLLYALSGLVKNNQTYQAAADTQGLFEWLLDIGIRHPTRGIAKKSMGLLDIAFSQSPKLEVLNTLTAKQNVLAASLLAQIHSEQSSPDADAAEKALRLVNRLLSLRPMLFESSFRSDFTQAVAAATRNCEQTHAVGDELCTGLMGLAEHASMTLAARDLPDDEL
jgi:hypothetical protein